jgi:hypothetical protein
LKLHSLIAAGLLACCAAALQAAPEPPLLEGAGPQPTEDQARQAVIDELKRTLNNPADFKRVRFLSGPHLVTGISFADNREQAWQMCVIQGDANISRGSPDVDVKQYFLRSKSGTLKVVPAVNWKSYDSKC